VQYAFDAAFTIGVQFLPLNEVGSSGGNPLIVAITPTNNTRVFLCNLQGANYIRVNMTSGAAGVTPRIVLSQAPHVPTYTNVQQSSSSNLLAQISGSVGLSISSTGGAGNYYTLVSAATNNLTQIKSGSTSINSLNFYNTSATAKWVKIFNLLSASVTMGTTSPVLNIGIPPLLPFNFDCGAYGIRLNTGYTIAITGGSALLDSTAVVAGDVIVNSTYT
jgi:hypothetical protein